MLVNKNHAIKVRFNPVKVYFASLVVLVTFCRHFLSHVKVTFFAIYTSTFSSKVAKKSARKSQERSEFSRLAFIWQTCAPTSFSFATHLRKAACTVATLSFSMDSRPSSTRGSSSLDIDEIKHKFFFGDILYVDSGFFYGHFVHLIFYGPYCMVDFLCEYSA